MLAVTTIEVELKAILRQHLERRLLKGRVHTSLINNSYLLQ
ncbi:MAG: hypothetical protein ACTS73_02255 [Arsenophonus sp. NEOnobi-MAG3]